MSGSQAIRTDGTVELADIEAAAVAIAGAVDHTPMVTAVGLDEQLGGPVVLKAESLQRTGSFKIRGATHKLRSLGEAARRGVTAGSAGNHAQALAFAARALGVPCEIFVPADAAISKVEACRRFGATVVEGGASVGDAVAAATARADETGMRFCHPFDDPAVVAGQGTVGLEILEDAPDVDEIIVPLGGGGLAAGTAIAVKSRRPEVRLVAVQAEACAPFAGGEVPHGPVATLADGIAVKRPGSVTGPLIERWIDDVVTVDEDSIADAMVLAMDTAKLTVEGGGAVGIAALLSGAVTLSHVRMTCVILSGGNVDLGLLPGLIRRHENEAGRRLAFFAKIPDRPGRLVELLSVFADHGANLIEVEHVREGVDLHVRETGLHATFEVRDRAHGQRAVAAARAAGYELRLDTPWLDTPWLDTP